MQSILKYQLKARALPYAIFISLLVAALCVGLIQFAGLQQSEQNDYFLNKKLQHNLESALTIGLKTPAPYHRTTSLFNTNTDSILLLKKEWGLFDLLHAEAFQQTTWGKKTKSETLFLGSTRDSFQNKAVYATERNKPLVLAGTAELNGDIHISKSGLKRGYINGIPYQGVKLQQSGQQFRSRSMLPGLHNPRINTILQLFQIPISGQSMVSEQVEQTFTDSTLYLIGDYVLLDGQRLKGNIIVWASEAIVIAANTQLEDVILVAPEITFEDGFQGSCQAFASENISIGSFCNFSYPSVLGLFKTNTTTTESPSLLIAENASIDGLVFCLEKKKDKKSSLIKVMPKARIQGQIYTEGLMDLRGEVWGNVSCTEFLLKTPFSTYSNHILDGKIDANRLSKDFVFPIFYKQQKINKWVKRIK